MFPYFKPFVAILTHVKTVLSILNNAKGAYKVEEFNDNYLTYTDDDSDFSVLINKFVDVIQIM